MTATESAELRTARRAVEQERRDADELLRILRLDPDIYRTECGYINMPKVKAALANPGDYPMLPEDEAPVAASDSGKG